MGISLDRVISELLLESQKRVCAKAKEEIKIYKSLQAFRKVIGLTQEELAGKLSLKQTNISQLESRSDMHISTLRRYVEALGCELEINIRIPNKKTIRLDT